MSHNKILIILLIIISVIAVSSSFVFEQCSTASQKSPYWNTQQLAKIDKSKTTYSFVVYGDNRDSSNRFKKMLLNINKKGALFAIANGDLVTNGTKKEFYSFLKQLKISKIPTLTTIGTHDINSKKGSSTYRQIFGPTSYSFAMKNSYFIIVNNANNKGLTQKQMKWLIKKLKKSQKYKYRFVLFHSPLYDPRKGKYVQGHSMNNLKNARILNNLFDRYKVTMVISSHIHGYFKGKWHKTNYIITGGGGVALAGTNPHNFFFHYILVKVSDKKVSYTVVRY